MNRSPGRKSVVLLCLLIALISLSITACRQREIELPFETIEQRDTSGTGKVYEDKRPGLMIVAKSDEAANLDALVTSDAQTNLQSLDYNQYFAIAAFQGWKPTTGYSVQIERITHSGNIVIIYAKFQELRLDEEKGDEETSPYHLVKAQKVGTWVEKIVFNLVVADSTVASLAHDVP